MDKTPNRLHFEFDATPEKVRETMVLLRKMLADTDAETGSALEIVLGEVLNNVVEHALAGRSDGRVVLTCRQEALLWHIEVRDNGAPMPGGELPTGTPPRLDTAPADLPEGGFGWALVRLLARDIHYARHRGWNRLNFDIPA